MSYWFKFTDEIGPVYPLTREILADAKSEGVPSRILAMNRIKEKIINIRTKKVEPLPFDEILKLARERFGL